MALTKRSNREVWTGYEAVEKRRGQGVCPGLAVFWRGADGLFISAPCFLAFPLCVLPGKLSHKSGDVGSSPCAGTRPQFYRLGETSFLAALPPCAFAHGDEFKNLRQTQERFFRQFFHEDVSCCCERKYCCLIQVRPPAVLLLSDRPDSQPIPEAYSGVPAGIQPGCKFRVSVP